MQPREGLRWRVTARAPAWSQAYRFVNLVLRLDARVGWVLDPLEGFARGDFLVEADELTGPRVRALAELMALELHAVPRDQQPKTLQLKPTRVAIYGGGGAPYSHARILAECGFDISFVSGQGVQTEGLAAWDVFIVPGGGRTATAGQLRLLGEQGARQVAAFVEQGGLYLGSCAGAHNVCVIPAGGRPRYGQQMMQMINIGKWRAGDTVWNWQQFPGVGVIESRNLRPDHPVMFGLPETFAITHYNGPLFTPTRGALAGASDAIPLARVVGYTKDFTPNEYTLAFDTYAGAAPGSVIEGAINAGGINAAVGTFGRGRVVVFGSHPEFGYSLEMDEYQTPARMLANAVLWQSANTAARETITSRAAEGYSNSEVPASGLSMIPARTSAIHAVAAELLARGVSPLPSWLRTTQAMSTFGLAPEAIWRRTLEGFDRIGERLLSSAARVKMLAAMLGEGAREILVELDRALRYEAPAEWDQDFGYQGLLKTLDMTEELLKGARDNFSIDLPESQDPYEHDDVSPYHLVAASYYSALGLYMNAWFLLRVYEARLEDLDLLRGAASRLTAVEGAAAAKSRQRV
jgi:biotin protein ligase-like protein